MGRRRPYSIHQRPPSPTLDPTASTGVAANRAMEAHRGGEKVVIGSTHHGGVRPPLLTERIHARGGRRGHRRTASSAEEEREIVLAVGPPTACPHPSRERPCGPPAQKPTWRRPLLLCLCAMELLRAGSASVVWASEGGWRSCAKVSRPWRCREEGERRAKCPWLSAREERECERSTREDRERGRLVCSGLQCPHE